MSNSGETTITFLREGAQHLDIQMKEEEVEGELEIKVIFTKLYPPDPLKLYSRQVPS